MPHGRGRTCPDRRYKADGRLRESRGPGIPGAGLAGRTGVGVVGFRRL